MEYLSGNLFRELFESSEVWTRNVARSFMSSRRDRHQERHRDTRHRYNPMGRDERETERDCGHDSGDDEIDFADFIKVSHRDDIHRLAGKLAWNTRRSEHMPMLASGSAAIGTAIEAIAEARRFLSHDEEPTELFCQPAFRDRNMGSSLAFYLTSGPKRPDNGEVNSVEFSASKASKPAVVAGAIAARAREGIGPVVTAIGDEAVTNAVLAACRARIYLEDDQLDIRFIPEQQMIQKRGGDGVTKTMTSMKLHLYVDRVEPSA